MWGRRVWGECVRGEGGGERWKMLGERRMWRVGMQGVDGRDCMKKRGICQEGLQKEGV